MRADDIDALIYEEMRNKLSEFSVLSKQQPETNQGVSFASAELMKYINLRITELEQQKKDLCARIYDLEHQSQVDTQEITEYLQCWDQLSNSDKVSVVDCLIESIYASKNGLKITWKI